MADGLSVGDVVTISSIGLCPVMLLDNMGPHRLYLVTGISTRHDGLPTAFIDGIGFPAWSWIMQDGLTPVEMPDFTDAGAVESWLAE